MKKTAAIYARVSSDRQREEQTIASQRAALQEYVQKHDYLVPPQWIFEDDGYSAGTLARPGLERLRDLVAEGQVETVLVYHPDRFSRNYAYQVLLVEEFSRHGVQTVFLKSVHGDTPEERLMVQFQGMIAEYERAQIAERTRRGKRYRAKAGCVNVLCGAPYGYRYVRKTESSDAHYIVVEAEAEVVREIFQLYTRQLCSIGAIARQLNERKVPTRFGKSRWERSTVWGMLRNPAYEGKACFGKTERAPRKRITKPLRAKGGFSRRPSSNQERKREDWIEVPVPALVDAATFAMAQERLEENKRLSARRTKLPTLLQGLLVCGQCGYGLYRTSTKTTKRQVQYYRCLGSDGYRHLRGPVCSCKPIRQDYLDELIWKEVVQLLRCPELLRNELKRRVQENLGSDPAQQRKERLERERKRVATQVDKLLDAYQEDLVGLAELRRRMPELRRRQGALENELQSVTLQAIENSRLIELKTSMEAFLKTLAQSSATLDIAERQKVIRLVVKQIIVGADTITVQHSIPAPGGPGELSSPGYALCTRSHDSPLRGALIVLRGRHFLAFLFLHDGGGQPHPDELQNAPIGYPHFHARHKLVVGNRIKIPLEVRVVYFSQPVLKVLTNLFQRLMRRPFRTESIRAVLEIRLEYRFDDDEHGHLDHPILEGRDAQRPHFASVAFGDIDAFDRLGSIAPLLELLLDPLNKRLDSSRLAFHRFAGHPIDPTGFLIPSHQLPCCLQHVCPVDVSVERVKPKSPLLLCLLTELPSQKVEFLRQQIRLDRIPIQVFPALGSVVGVSPNRLFLH